MIIGIDGNEANQKVRTGSGVYAFELLLQFEKSASWRIKYQIYLKDTPIADLPKESSQWKYLIVGPRSFWTQVGLPIELWKEKILGKAPDVFFSPTHYAPRFCPVPSVITIFDLAFLRFPEVFLKKDLYQLQNWTQYSVKQAKKIITISEFSKKEIIDYYKVDPGKIVIAYPGFDKERFNNRITNDEVRITNVKNKYKISGDYILYVGTIQPRKNLVRLLETFTILDRKAKPIQDRLKLVICGMIKEGRGGWMQEELLDRINNLELRIKNNIVITGFVVEEDLAYLMAGAKAIVLPSLYEGFGIPVIEAMACGVPAVISNVSSLPEIAGNSAILVDPYNTDSLAQGLKEACYNKTKRQDMIKKGLIQVKKYNWTDSAKHILDTLISL